MIRDLAYHLIGVLEISENRNSQIDYPKKIDIIGIGRILDNTQKSNLTIILHDINTTYDSSVKCNMGVQPDKVIRRLLPHREHAQNMYFSDVIHKRLSHATLHGNNNNVILSNRPRLTTHINFMFVNHSYT